MLRLLGKVWPVGGPLLVSSQRGKGPFGVGCNGVAPTRSSPVNPVPAGRGSVQRFCRCCCRRLWLIANCYLLLANGSCPCSATETPSATIPLPVNFLAVMQLSGRAD